MFVLSCYLYRDAAFAQSIIPMRVTDKQLHGAVMTGKNVEKNVPKLAKGEDKPRILCFACDVTLAAAPAAPEAAPVFEELLEAGSGRSLARELDDP